MGGQGLPKGSGKNKTLAQKIVDGLREFLDKIYDLLWEQANRENDLAMKAALQADEAEAWKMLKNFEGVIEHTLEMERKQKAARAAKESTENGTSDEVKYSLVLNANTARIDYYTEKEYNDYGWIYVNGVLTGKELKKLYSQFADKKLLNFQYSKTADGYYMIPVGDK